MKKRKSIKKVVESSKIKLNETFITHESQAKTPVKRKQAKKGNAGHSFEIRKSGRKRSLPQAFWCSTGEDTHKLEDTEPQPSRRKSDHKRSLPQANNNNSSTDTESQSTRRQSGRKRSLPQAYWCLTGGDACKSEIWQKFNKILNEKVKNVKSKTKRKVQTQTQNIK